MDETPQSNLSMEQEFCLRSFSDQTQLMSEAAAKEYLVWLYNQYVIREVSYNAISGGSWAIELPKIM